MSNQPFDQTRADKPTKDVAADEAKNVAQNAQNKGKHVAENAKGEARELAGEAKDQARGLLHQVRSEATSQVSGQQEKLAGSLRTMSDQLDQISQGKSVESGTATDLISQAAGQVGQIAGWLENREPADLLREVRRYARRNPGTFLAGAALLGLVGGRLTRGLQDDARDDDRGRDGRQGYGAQGYRTQGYGDQSYGTQGYRADQGYGYTERTPEYGYRAAHAEPGYTGQAYDDRGYTSARVYDQETAAPAPYGDETTTYVTDQAYGDTAESRGQDRPGSGEVRR